MAAKWFVQTADLIDGPLTTEDVHARLQGGQLRPENRIWARGLDQWFSLQAWSADPHLTALSHSQHETPQPETWHFAIDGETHGPMLREGLIQNLKTVSALGSVMLWTKGMTEWVPLFEFHDLLTEIGINKRQFPRAELTGKAVIKTAEGTTLVAPLVSISEGGFGIQLDRGVVAGQILSVELHSPAFHDAIHVKAELRYTGRGVLGLKFLQLSPEIKGAIIQFVRQRQAPFMAKAA